MTKWLALLISCLALGLVGVGCGDDDDDSGGDSAETPSSRPRTADPAAAARPAPPSRWA